MLDSELGQLHYFVNEQGKSQKPRGSLPLIGASVTQSDEAPHMFIVNSVNGELYKLRGKAACVQRSTDPGWRGGVWCWGHTLGLSWMSFLDCCCCGKLLKSATRFKTNSKQNKLQVDLVFAVCVLRFQLVLPLHTVNIVELHEDLLFTGNTGLCFFFL